MAIGRIGAPGAPAVFPVDLVGLQTGLAPAVFPCMEGLPFALELDQPQNQAPVMKDPVQVCILLYINV